MLRFAKAIGIYDQIEAQKAALNSQTTNVGGQYVAQILSSFPDLSEQFKDDIDRAYNQFLGNTADYIDTESAVASYLGLVSERMTKKEIKKVTKFYESALGKKFTQTNTEVAGDWTRSFMEDAQEKVSAAMQSYTQRLQEIVAKVQEEQGQ